MSFLRAFSMLSPMLLRGLLSLPLMLLATGLWAAHHEHPTATDLAIQALLLLFMAALLVNVVISVVAILRQRETSGSADHPANPIASELEPQGPARPAAKRHRPPPNSGAAA